MRAARSRFAPGRSALAAALALIAAATVPKPVAAADIDPKFDPAKVTAPALRPIPKATPERFTLKNGMVVYLLENHELPRVQGTAYVRSSPLWVPDDKVGLGVITGRTMRTGGSVARTGDWLDDRLGAIGASISTSISSDFANGGFNCLSDNTREVVGLWSEVLQKPAFPDDKVELGRVGVRREIAQLRAVRLHDEQVRIRTIPVRDPVAVHQLIRDVRFDFAIGGGLRLRRVAWVVAALGVHARDERDAIAGG